MINNTSQINSIIKDPVPKNVSKFPIHQTYLTDDAQPTGTGGYKFKCPEVWSSARSAKKSIAIRSIQWLPKTLFLQFAIDIKVSDGAKPATYSTKTFKYSAIIPERTPLYDTINSIISKFTDWTEKEQAAIQATVGDGTNETITQEAANQLKSGLILI